MDEETKSSVLPSNLESLQLQPLDSLGRGGFGNVVKANAANGKVYALKVCTMKRDWLDELKIYERLTKNPHPNVLPISGYEIDYHHSPAVLKTITELGDCSLDNLVKFRGYFSDDEVFFILFQCVQGLQHLHDFNIFHGDIKPGNLLLQNNRVRIFDFGVSSTYEETPNGDATIRTRGYTEGYIPPEVSDIIHKGSITIDAYAFDLYSLGITMATFISKHNNGPLLKNFVDQLTHQNPARRGAAAKDIVRLYNREYKNISVDLIGDYKVRQTEIQGSERRKSVNEKVEFIHGLVQLGQYTKAKAKLEEIKPAVQEADPYVAYNYYMVNAEISGNQGDHVASLEILKKAEDHYKRNRNSKFFEDHENLEQKLSEKLAQAYNQVHNYKPRALKFLEEKHGPNLLNDLGSVLQSDGHAEEANECYKKSLEIKSKELGPDDVSAAITYINIASTYQEKGLYDEAFETNERAIKILKDNKSVSLNLVMALNNAGKIRHFQRKYDEAIPYFKQSMEVAVKIYERKHSQYSCLLVNLANSLSGCLSLIHI
eukprot:TRINITY_DN11565_c0_g2_i3.p1 TRINITY_DN11565_c0_g2~~TRINITY_DN11565_c0_g2_i3.p1  ORF type:complete len:543 (-),score=41.82 TRINITY_DN11565_c0_g2_i3:64-1692(-)